MIVELIKHQCDKTPVFVHTHKENSKWILELDDDNCEISFCPFCGMKL